MQGEAERGCVAGRRHSHIDLISIRCGFLFSAEDRHTLAAAFKSSDERRAPDWACSTLTSARAKSETSSGGLDTGFLLGRVSPKLPGFDSDTIPYGPTHLDAKLRQCFR